MVKGCITTPSQTRPSQVKNAKNISTQGPLGNLEYSGLRYLDPFEALDCSAKRRSEVLSNQNVHPGFRNPSQSIEGVPSESDEPPLEGDTTPISQPRVCESGVAIVRFLDRLMSYIHLLLARSFPSAVLPREVANRGWLRNAMPPARSTALADNWVGNHLGMETLLWMSFRQGLISTSNFSGDLHRHYDTSTPPTSRDMFLAAILIAWARSEGLVVGSWRGQHANHCVLLVGGKTLENAHSSKIQWNIRKLAAQIFATSSNWGIAWTDTSRVFARNPWTSFWATDCASSGRIISSPTEQGVPMKETFLSEVSQNVASS